MKFVRLLPILVVAACAVRMGGGKPVQYNTVAIEFPANTTPADAAARLRELNADVALVATHGDTAWVRQLATATQKVATRPGKAGNLTLAFLATKPVGDTTLTLTVEGGGGIRLHDALFTVDKNRNLDLMTAVIEPNTNVRNAVRALLNYIATDVGGTSAVALAVQAANQAVGDSVALLTRAAIADTWECTQASKSGQPAPAMAMRLFYFPSARMKCATARVVDIPNRPVVANLIVP